MTVQIELNGVTYELPSHITVLPEAIEEHMTKMNLTREDMSEGIWIAMHEKDIEDYKNDVVDTEYTRVCALLNHAVCGIPWGAYVPYKLQGDERPIAIFEEIINPETDEVHFPPAVLKAYQEAHEEEVSEADIEAQKEIQAALLEALADDAEFPHAALENHKKANTNEDESESN